MEPSRLLLADFAGKRTLIVGEVKVGKTMLLSEVLGLFLGQAGEPCAVIDLAPRLIKGIGGKMALPRHPALASYCPDIHAPRLSGKNPEEVAQLAEANGRAADRVFAQYLAEPAPWLFVNDVSLYLQARPLKGLARLWRAAETVVANGYLGRALGGGSFGETERRRMEELQAICDRVITLPQPDA